MRVALFSYHPAPYRDPVFDLFHKLYGDEVYYKVFFARDIDTGHKYQQIERKKYNNEVLNIEIKSVFHRATYRVNYKKLGKLVESEHFDIVLIPGHCDTFNLPLLQYCIKHKIPYILTSDSIALNKTNPIRNLIKYYIEKKYIRQAASLYVPGKASVDFSVSMGAKREAVFEGAYCLDAHELDKEADKYRAERTAIRESLGIKPDEVLFLFAGRFIKECDFYTMLKAYAKARTRNSKIRLALFGDGNELLTIKKLISNDAIEGVLLHDFVPINVISKYYVASDAYLMTYSYGNYSLACVQAAICRLPIITTQNLGAAYDVVVDGKSGILTTKGDIDVIAKAITSVASMDETARSRMGDAGRQLAITRTPEWAAVNLNKAIQYASNK